MEKRDLAFVGFGAAPCASWFPGLAEEGYLERFLDLHPLFLEAGPRNQELALGGYKNQANSPARSFFAAHEDPYNEALQGSEGAIHLRRLMACNPRIRLNDLKPFLSECRASALETIEAHGGASIQFETPLTAVQNESGTFHLFSGEKAVAQVNKVILATGALERPNPVLQRMAGERLQLSSEILRGNLSKIKALKGRDSAAVVLVGSSHAAAAVLDLVSEEDDRPITLIGREIFLVDNLDHVHDGVRLMKGRFENMMKGRGPDRFVQVQSGFEEAHKMIESAELVVQCLGLQSVLPMEQGTQTSFFDVESGRPKVLSPYRTPSKAQCLYRGNQLCEGAWGFGVGFAPAYPGGGFDAGIDSFRSHAKLIVEQLLGLG